MQFPPDVERWRPLVAKYFPAHLVDKALWVIMYESGGNPSAVGDGGVAQGLFQIHDATSIPGRPSAQQLQDPEFNIRYAAQVLGAAQGNWKPWGENNTYNGKPFGALGFHPFPGDTGGRAATGETVRPQETTVQRFGGRMSITLPRRQVIYPTAEGITPSPGGADVMPQQAEEDSKAPGRRARPPGAPPPSPFSYQSPRGGRGKGSPTPSPSAPSAPPSGAGVPVRDTWLDRIDPTKIPPVRPSAPEQSSFSSVRPMPITRDEFAQELAFLRSKLDPFILKLAPYAPQGWNPFALSVDASGNVVDNLIPANTGIAYLTSPLMDDEVGGKQIPGYSGPGVYVKVGTGKEARLQKIATREEYLEARNWYDRYLGISDAMQQIYSPENVDRIIAWANAIYGIMPETLAFLDASDEQARQQRIAELAESMADKDVLAGQSARQLKVTSNPIALQSAIDRGVALAPYFVTTDVSPSRAERLDLWRNKLGSMIPSLPKRPQYPFYDVITEFDPTKPVPPPGYSYQSEIPATMVNGPVPLLPDLPRFGQR